jgi:2,4-dienoyl-CoA reductase-like NADH-dependent reductase (Old Yellow Enzyme family)
VGPSAVPFADGHPVPAALGEAEYAALPGLFAAAARRALAAGFRAVEVHAAHGYLLHQHLSPLSNRREDRWGGPFEHRTRLAREVVAAVRQAWPERLPLLVRVSATDWAEGGWTPEETVALARALRDLGADLVDCSSGGLVPYAKVPVAPGYQVPFAERIRREAGVATAAVGLVTTPAQAEAIVAGGQADLVLLGRELLRDPRFPLRAAAELGADGPWPKPYLRARP